MQMLGMIDRVAFRLFGLEIYWYAIIIVSAVILAMWLASREAVRVGLKADDVTDFMLVGLPLALIGARLYYILFDLEPYLQDPIQIFNVRSGGLAIYGGLIAAIIWLFFLSLQVYQYVDVSRYCGSHSYPSPRNRALGQFYESRSLWTKNQLGLLGKIAFASVYYRQYVYRRSVSATDFPL